MSILESPAFPGRDSFVRNVPSAMETGAGIDRMPDVHVSGETPKDGAELLNQVHWFIGRFIAYPSKDAHVAHALWIVHAHLMAAWETTPRLAFLSAEPSSGKTRALEVTALLVPKSVHAVNVSPSYLFRRVAAPEGRPTILYDEIDAIFGPKSKPQEDLRALINAGYRKGAEIGRCVVSNGRIDTQEMPAYCAVALAGLGRLPDTIMTRAVVIRMRKRGPMEKVESFRFRDVEPEGKRLREAVEAWAAQIESDVERARPKMPAGVEDRDADIWEPLLAIADAAGGGWPDAGRVACVSLVTQARESTPSLGVRLLADMQDVLSQSDVMTTAEILNNLLMKEESPWGNVEGRQLDSRMLANLLKPYDIRPKVVRMGDRTVRGYESRQFLDAWQRYVQPST